MVFNNVDDLKAITIPAWNTAEFKDADGNLIAHFDQARPYDKSGDLTKLSDHSFPITMTLTACPASATHNDGSF
jgi:hypothetical protein